MYPSPMSAIAPSSSVVTTRPLLAPIDIAVGDRPGGDPENPIVRPSSIGDRRKKGRPMKLGLDLESAPLLDARFEMNALDSTLFGFIRQDIKFIGIILLLSLIFTATTMVLVLSNPRFHSKGPVGLIAVWIGWDVFLVVELVQALRIPRSVQLHTVESPLSEKWTSLRV